MPTDAFWQEFGSSTSAAGHRQGARYSGQGASPCCRGLERWGRFRHAGGACGNILLIAVQLDLHFFHIHHGLQDAADHWQAHVHDLAQWLRVPCHSRVVQVNMATGAGIESAARDARYEAFRHMARQVGLQHILLAHHRNDQAETVLLRLLRGAGPMGLAAMSASVQRQGIIYLRPWLDVERAEILKQAERFRQISGWAPVQDPTNADDKYTRAAVRERLVPALNERWPGWQSNVSRHARQSAEAQQVLWMRSQPRISPGLIPTPDASSFSFARVASAFASVDRRWCCAIGFAAGYAYADRCAAPRPHATATRSACDGSRQANAGQAWPAWIRCARGRVLVELRTAKKRVP